jgi:hypothetical protein
VPAHHGLRDDPTQLCYGPRRAPDAADVDGAALVAACAAAWVACRFSILSTSSAGAPAQRRGLRRSYIPTRARKQAPPSTSHRLSQLLEGDKQPEQSVSCGPVHHCSCAVSLSVSRSSVVATAGLGLELASPCVSTEQESRWRAGSRPCVPLRGTAAPEGDAHTGRGACHGERRLA